MRCSDRRDLLPEHLLGLLPEDEAAPLRAHLATGCPTCAAALAEAEVMLALIPQALPPASPRPELRARVLQAATAGTRDGRRPPLRLVPLAWAASLLLAVGGALWLSGRTNAQRLGELQVRIEAIERDLAGARSQLAEVRAEKSGLATQLAAANETIGMLRAEKLQLVTLAAAGPQPAAARARALWDQDTQHWQLIATGLMPTKPGRVYELWFITADDRKVPAGTFVVDERGQVVHTVDVPRDIGVIAVAAVTDEPGLMMAPTGEIHLAGKL